MAFDDEGDRKSYPSFFLSLPYIKTSLTGGQLPPEPDVRGLLPVLDERVQGDRPRGDRDRAEGALIFLFPLFNFLRSLAWPMPPLFWLGFDAPLLLLRALLRRN